ncbi:hypothetical protein WR25_11114 [Diploscapter pachys]|uniref:Uncharacterized protein n=1 Tax=Diploscapter pachys TaxID=2018661 RepID=A0A2A2LZ69_9BILA|nr:hypothetical protein WR25_11114 [Diploscapter pachys]
MSASRALKRNSHQAAEISDSNMCSDAWNGLSSSSPLATTPIVAYTGTISATFVLQFRATNTNVTDVKPPPPPFPSSSSNVYKHVHIDAYNYYYNRSLFRKFGSISSMWPVPKSIRLTSVQLSGVSSAILPYFSPQSENSIGPISI